MLSSTISHLQKTMQTKIYQIGQILPVWPNTKLLAGTRQQALLQEILPLSALPEAHFKALYRSAINAYAEFVQLISEEPQGGLGGLLNLGLARGCLALRQYVADNKIDADPLINYAIFTAGLFFDVAKVISQQRIVTCDLLGNYLQDWYPYSGAMVEQGVEYYKMYPYNTSAYQALNHEAAAMLARQLMPRDGFLWLSSDLELFIDWLDALRGEKGEGGRRIGRILSLIRQEDLLGFIKTLSIQVEPIIPKEMPLVDQFIIWLRDGLANGSLAINTNEANVHLLDDGTLFLNNDVFKKFADTKQTTIEVGKLQREFNTEFAINTQVSQEKAHHTGTFLAQSWEQKNSQVRNGMLVYAAQFMANYAGIQISPIERDIKTGIHQNRQLPGTAVVKQATINERRDSGPSFKMR